MNMLGIMPMDRRALLHRAMLVLGATAVASCEYLPGSKQATTLAEEEFALLSAYADTLIPQTDTPGAVAAGVPRIFAQMFADWASDDTRMALTGALERLESAARKDAGAGFAALAPAKRKSFLAEYDKHALTEVPPPADSPKGNPFQPVVSVVDNGYHRLKELVAVLYYSSEAALTHELVYEHVPGGWTSSVTVTPETRPAITFGAF